MHMHMYMHMDMYNHVHVRQVQVQVQVRYRCTPCMGLFWEHRCIQRPSNLLVQPPACRSLHDHAPMSLSPRPHVALTTPPCRSHHGLSYAPASCSPARYAWGELAPSPCVSRLPPDLWYPAEL